MESGLYRVHVLVIFVLKNLTRSLRSLVRILIRQHPVRKYLSRALSMMLSMYICFKIFVIIKN